ncbi:hypothetical protein [Brevundimonas sp.]|uniref:hypothetical protein n=1 Tax=Brevundimonas sp. TaxID=1871086 RepID=UPI0022C9B0EF|nr:hypothetical protein [Brevundimonas sp.]MCZ8194997.1 hypothetical protein [Brevundimonas sp.]
MIAAAGLLVGGGVGRVALAGRAAKGEREGEEERERERERERARARDRLSVGKVVFWFFVAWAVTKALDVGYDAAAKTLFPPEPDGAMPAAEAPAPGGRESETLVEAGRDVDRRGQNLSGGS